LRSLYEDADWHGLVRRFIDQHRCQSPYFLEISQEFLDFVMRDFPAREVDPPFIAELAHYEWVELALDTAGEVLPEAGAEGDPLTAVPRLSPLALSLMYRYPVHRIGPRFRPGEAGEPVYLVVYRNRADEVRFMELNAVTSRLLEKVRDNETASGRDLLVELARESGLSEEAVLAHGADQLREFVALSVVLLTPG
jgi:hypothetical protein